MTQRERTTQKYRMQAYRTQKRLSEFRLIIFQLKEKVANKEVVLSESANDIFSHALKIAEQI
jgi:hypothetical protein